MESGALVRLRRARMGELLSSLDAQWSEEAAQLEGQLSLLRSQLAEASAQLRDTEQAKAVCLAEELRQAERDAARAWRAHAEQADELEQLRIESRRRAEAYKKEQAALVEANALITELEREATLKAARPPAQTPPDSGSPITEHSPAGKSDWVEATDGEGRQYYWNVQTQATSWSKPEPHTSYSHAASAKQGDAEVEGWLVEGGSDVEHGRKLEQKVAIASKRLRAAGAALAEQQQLVHEAMSVGAARVLNAVFNASVSNRMSRALTQWSLASMAMARGDLAAGTRSKADVLYHCLLTSIGSHSLWAFARWCEAVRGLRARRFLQLTHEMLSDHQHEIEDAHKQGGRMRVLALIVLTRTRALHSAFLWWANVQPYGGSEEAHSAAAFSSTDLQQLRRNVSQLSSGSPEWQRVAQQVLKMCATIERERSAHAAKLAEEEDQRHDLCAKLSRLQARLQQPNNDAGTSLDGHGRDEGDLVAASCMRAAQTAAAAASHAAFQAERENVMLREALEKAQGSLGMSALYPGPYNASSDHRGAPISYPPWSTPWDPSAIMVRRHADSPASRPPVVPGRVSLADAPVSDCSSFQNASSLLLDSAAAAFSAQRMRPKAASLAKAAQQSRSSRDALRSSRTGSTQGPRGPVALHAKLNWDIVRRSGDDMAATRGADPWELYSAKYPSSFDGLPARYGSGQRRIYF